VVITDPCEYTTYYVYEALLLEALTNSTSRRVCLRLFPLYPLCHRKELQNLLFLTTPKIASVLQGHPTNKRSSKQKGEKWSSKPREMQEAY
jgi:hypothetical protein